MEYLFFLGRILLGGFFIVNGYGHLRHLDMLTGYARSKGVPLPKIAVFFTGLMLLVGGLGILFWMHIKFSVLILAIFLIVTTFKMHTYWKDTDQMTRMNNMINFQKNIALLGAVLILLAVHAPWVSALG